MKVTLLSTLFILGIGLSLTAQNVFIPDVNFKANLLANSSINTNSDNEIQVSEAEAYTGTIFCINSEISDLTGLEHFTSLTNLNCGFNSISNLDVSSNVSLSMLWCGVNQLTSLDLSNNPNLTNLQCPVNSITELDLSNNPNLAVLHCDRNDLTSLDLSTNNSLFELWAFDNDLDFLDVSNGNNSNISSFSFDVSDNENLTCIKVDNESYSNQNWTNKDSQSSFTANDFPEVNAGFDQTICEGELTVLAGQGAVEYEWDNEITNNQVFSAPLGVTTYTLTGVNEEGCQATDQVTVTVLAKPVVQAGQDLSVCEGETISLSASGGSDYEWSNGIVNNESFVPNLGVTEYSVTVIGDNGCSAVDDLVVTVNSLPAVEAGANISACEGETIMLSGSGASVYEWGSGIENNVAFMPSIGVTSYMVTGTDANGCVNTDNVVITVNELPSIEAGINQTICEGETVILSAGGAVTYEWGNGVTNDMPFTPSTGVTSYAVAGTDANGCANTANVVITVNELPSIEAGVDQMVCEGETVTLSALGAMTYEWSNDVTNNTAFTPSVGVTSYMVTGTDINGCANTDNVIISTNSNPTVEAGIDLTVCEGETVTLTASGANTMQWNNGVTNGVAFIPTIGNTSFNVTGTDAQGCSSTDDVTITVNALPAVDAGADITVCSGELAVLSASGASTFSWSNGVSDNVAFIPETGNSNYVVTGIDINGCVNSDEVIITATALPNVTTTVIDNTITANQASASYQWIDCGNSNEVIEGETNVNFSPIESGDYAVTVTMNGCSATSDCENISIVGINETDLFNEVNVYPNPIVDNVSLELGELKNVAVTVHSITGELVYKAENLNSTIHRFNFDSASGIYILSLMAAGESAQYKLIKE
ncbi:MAG: T9SS type A sorting domain-containing protein [Flavobacteriales bacterium]